MREGGRERGREGVAGNFTTLTTQFMADGGGCGNVDFEGAEIFARSPPPSIRGTNFHFHALPRSTEHMEWGSSPLWDTNANQLDLVRVPL